MSSAGHIFEMIAKLKANDARKKRRKNYFQRDQDFPSLGESLITEPIDPIAIAEAKNKGISYLKREKMLRIIALALSGICTLVLLYFIFKN